MGVVHHCAFPFLLIVPKFALFCFPCVRALDFVLIELDHKKLVRERESFKSSKLIVSLAQPTE